MSLERSGKRHTKYGYREYESEEAVSVENGDLTACREALRKLQSSMSAQNFNNLINMRLAPSDHTLLTLAASLGHVHIVNNLLEFKADPNKKDKKGNTYLADLSSSIPNLLKDKKYDSIKQVLEYKNIPYTTHFSSRYYGSPEYSAESALLRAMLYALIIQDFASFQKLRSCLSDAQLKGMIDKQDGYNGYNQNENTLLHWAAYRGCPEIVNDLLKLNPDTNIKNKSGHDYLASLSLSIPHLLQQKNYDVIKQVLEYKGISLNVANRKGITAESAFFDAMVKSLKCDDLVRFEKLQSCLSENQFKGLIDMRDKFGNTLLMWAAYYGHAGIVYDLLELTADPKVKNISGHDYLAYLSISVIDLVKQKKYERFIEVLAYKGISLTVANDEGETAESTLHSAMIASLKSGDSEEFFKLMGCLFDSVRSSFINKKDQFGDTLLSVASEKNNQRVIQWLYQERADYRQDYQNKNNDFYQLPANAFSPPLEIKSSLFRSVYKKNEKLISTYKISKPSKPERLLIFLHFKKKPEYKLFRKQFYKLMDLYLQWGKENKCQNEDIMNGIQYLKKNLFLPEYSGMQSSQYYESIKDNLEKSLAALKNESIPLKMRIDVFTHLCTHFAVCGPGIFTHVEDSYNRLNANQSLEKWLAELRTNIIRVYSDRHNVEKKISPGNSIHSFSTFAAYAANQGWHPLVSAEKMKDPHASVAKITDEDLVKFHSYFVRNYNFEAIRNCIEFNMHEMLNQLCKEFGYQLNNWNTTSGDYNKFVERVNIALKGLGLQINEYFDLNEDSTEFFIDTKFILDKLCEKIMPLGLYFDSSQKQYVELFPKRWLEGRDQKDFDFTIWEKIPSKQFAGILFNIMNKIPDQYLSILIENVPKYQLSDLVAIDQVFDESLKVVSPQKQGRIKVMITNRLIASEEKSHLFFKPAKNDQSLKLETELKQPTAQEATLRNKLGFDGLYREDMKEINNYFIHAQGSPEMQAIRYQQGMKLIEIYEAIGDTLDKLEKLDKGSTRDETFIELLYALKTKINQGLVLLDANASDQFNEVIGKWAKVLTFYISNINKELEDCLRIQSDGTLTSVAIPQNRMASRN